ncbi:MAG: BON domain-containing protein [Candidatus Abyssubacteria bacterium]
MLRKVLVLSLAVLAVGVAVFSYSKYYARKDVSRMLAETRLAASVKTALALNRHLQEADIAVAVSDPIITLSGTVASDIQKELAEEITLSIKGVEKVQNNLTVNRALSFKPPKHERTLGERLDDLTIEASVKTALLLNEHVSARNIGVRSDRGAVVLTGTVISPVEAELARKIAEDVEGVTMVQTNLELAQIEDDPEGRKLAEKVDDARIVVQVRAALMVNRNIDSTEIEVSSRDGVVTLTGIVHSGAEKDLAQKITEDCWGVSGVINELRIK